MLFYLLSHTPVFHDAHMHFFGSIYRQVFVNAKRAYRLYMVGMVVCDKDSFNAGSMHSILDEKFFHCPQSDTAVNDNPVAVCKEKIAVTATSTS